MPFGSEVMAITTQEEEIPFPSPANGEHVSVPSSDAMSEEETPCLLGTGGCPTPPAPTPDAQVLPNDMVSRIEQLIAHSHANLTRNVLGAVDNLANRVEALNIQQDHKINQLNARIDSLVTRLDTLENGPSAASGCGEGTAGSPVKKGRSNPGTPSSKNSHPVSQASATQEKATNPACLRLRGFQYKLPKPDMIDVAKKLCKHIKIDSAVRDIHCSAIAGSCVVEFNTEQDARNSLELSKRSDTIWDDEETHEKVKLFFSYDESSEIRAMGSALHHIYDAVNKHIVPHGPKDTAIQTNRQQGLLQLKFNRRFYPLFQIGTSDDGESFHFIERVGRWKTFKIPPFVTPAMLDAVKTEVSAKELFH